MLDYDRNLFRSAGEVAASLDVLDTLWDAARPGVAGDPVAARSAAALLACGRWSWSAALARTERRGLHQRVDQPGTDPRQAARLVVGGLDRIAVHAEPVADAEELRA